MSHDSFIKTPKQLIWAVSLSFIVPIFAIVLLANYVSSQGRTGSGTESMTPEAIATRVAPVAKFEGQFAAPAAAAAAQTSSAPAAAPAAPAAAVAPAAPAPAAPPVSAVAPAKVVVAAAPVAAGKGAAPALFNQVCTACHTAGVAGAPKVGDKAAWAPRIAQGIDALTASAIKGKGAMPPKGGAAGASEAEIRAVVQYLIEQAK